MKISPFPLTKLTGNQVYEGVPFSLTDMAVIIGDNDWNLPQSTEIDIESGKYSEIHYISCAMYAPKNKGEKIAEFVLNYSDGETATVPVRNMIETHDWFLGANSSPEKKPVDKVTLDDYSTRHLFYTKIQNLYPNKILNKISFNSTGKGVVILLGITLRKNSGK